MLLSRQVIPILPLYYFTFLLDLIHTKLTTGYPRYSPAQTSSTPIFTHTAGNRAPDLFYTTHPINLDVSRSNKSIPTLSVDERLPSLPLHPPPAAQLHHTFAAVKTPPLGQTPVLHPSSRRYIRKSDGSVSKCAWEGKGESYVRFDYVLIHSYFRSPSFFHIFIPLLGRAFQPSMMTCITRHSLFPDLFLSLSD